MGLLSSAPWNGHSEGHAAHLRRILKAGSDSPPGGSSTFHLGMSAPVSGQASPSISKHVYLRSRSTTLVQALCFRVNKTETTGC